MLSPVIDTSVLIDMFLATSARHSGASALAAELVAKGISFNIPGFAFFEIRAALSQAKIEGRFKMGSGISEEKPLNFQIVPVDEAFVEKYFNAELPHLKGCDLVFLAMAKRDGAPLVTEDKKMLDAARATGVAAFSATEYLKELQK